MKEETMYTYIARLHLQLMRGLEVDADQHDRLAWLILEERLTPKEASMARSMNETPENILTDAAFKMIQTLSRKIGPAEEFRNGDQDKAFIGPPCPFGLNRCALRSYLHSAIRSVLYDLHRFDARHARWTAFPDCADPDQESPESSWGCHPGKPVLPLEQIASSRPGPEEVFHQQAVCADALAELVNLDRMSANAILFCLYRILGYPPRTQSALFARMSPNAALDKADRKFRSAYPFLAKNWLAPLYARLPGHWTCRIEDPLSISRNIRRVVKKLEAIQLSAAA